MQHAGLVILSAGASSRMGRAKALLPVAAESPAESTARSRTFVDAIAATARAAGVEQIVVVLGPPHGDAIKAALPAGARVAWNPAPERGMLGSIQAGVAALHDDAGCALIWPVDLPLVSVTTVRAVLDTGAGRIAAPQHRGRGGHPVKVPRALFAELLALPIESGLRALLHAHEALRDRVEVNDAGAVEDVDTPSDYRSRFGRAPGG